MIYNPATGVVLGAAVVLINADVPLPTRARRPCSVVMYSAVKDTLSVLHITRSLEGAAQIPNEMVKKQKLKAML